MIARGEDIEMKCKTFEEVYNNVRNIQNVQELLQRVHTQQLEIAIFNNNVNKLIQVDIDVMMVSIGESLYVYKYDGDQWNKIDELEQNDAAEKFFSAITYFDNSHTFMIENMIRLFGYDYPEVDDGLIKFTSPCNVWIIIMPFIFRSSDDVHIEYHSIYDKRR